jgi:hypothetical protein
VRSASFDRLVSKAGSIEEDFLELYVLLAYLNDRYRHRKQPSEKAMEQSFTLRARVTAFGQLLSDAVQQFAATISLLLKAASSIERTFRMIT